MNWKAATDHTYEHVERQSQFADGEHTETDIDQMREPEASPNCE